MPAFETPAQHAELLRLLVELRLELEDRFASGSADHRLALALSQRLAAQQPPSAQDVARAVELLRCHRLMKAAYDLVGEGA